jgi:hypothetical protein
MGLARTVAALAIAGLALPLGAASAQAASITFHGTVTAVTFDPGTPFAIGDTFDVTYQYDPATPDGNPTADTGTYAGAITSVSGSFSNGYTFTAGSGTISVQNDHVGLDEFSYASGSGGPGTSVDGFALNSIFALFVDANGSAISIPAIPSVGLLANLGQFVHKQVTFDFGAKSIQGSITAVTPIPAALLLFASSLGGLGLLGAKRRKAAE